jgi:phosphopantetheinyl transferase
MGHGNCGAGGCAGSGLGYGSWLDVDRARRSALCRVEAGDDVTTNGAGIVCALSDLDSAQAARLLARWGDGGGAGGSDRAVRLRRRRALGRALVRELLAERLGPGPWTLIADRDGKPHVAELAARPGIGISISHGGALVAAALSTLGPVGVDVERNDPERDVQAIAAYAFGPQEQGAVRAGGAGAFYRIWTLREAMAKAVGTGLAMVTDGMDRVAAAPVEGAWRSHDGRWLLACRALPAGYSAALAVDLQIGMAPREGAIEWRAPGV